MADMNGGDTEAASEDLSLLELEVLMLDCQTTGATPELGCVLELGWCLARASQPSPSRPAQAHWIALPAGQRVSSPVRQLTGFHEGLLLDALQPEEAWRRLRTSLAPVTPAPAPAPARPGPMPTAIHFARFELAFLQDWSRRFDPEGPFPIDAVCVHAIACRLYPDLPRRNLRALAGFLGHSLTLDRRARDHVIATAFIWHKLVVSLAERGIRSWSQLKSWLAAPVGSRTPRRRAYPMPRARYRALPDAPGVYRLLRSNGDVLYVGKAKSLRKRVASHFGKQRGATERALEMLTQVDDIAFEVTATALEAAVLESGLIKTLDPPYNIQLVRGDRAAWFASSDLQSTSPIPDQRHPVGPLPSRFSVRCLRAVIELIAGEPPDPARRAAATGAPRSFAPYEESFAGGWARFIQRRAADLVPGLARSRDPRILTLGIARDLLLLQAGEGARADDDGESVDPGDSEAGPAAAVGPPAWDPERVCRHLERSLASTYQVLRRSGWLCLLASSSVSFREPSHGAGRWLRLENAEVVASAEVTTTKMTVVTDLAELTPPAPSPRPPRAILQAAFDAARYDQLRVLTGELKRIERDGGEVAVRLSRVRVLNGARLGRILRLV